MLRIFCYDLANCILFYVLYCSNLSKIVKVLISTCYFKVVEAYLNILAQTGKFGLAINDTVDKPTAFEVNLNLT